MEKKQRSSALSKFTRNLNSLTNLLDSNAPGTLVIPQFEKFKQCYENLEDAHDTFIAVTEIDIETDKDGFAYMDGPSDQYNVIMKRYSESLTAFEEVERGQRREREKDDREAERENRRLIEEEKKVAEEQARIADLRAKFDSEEAKLNSAIDSFVRLNSCLKDSVGDASVICKKQEWQKIDKEFESLKGQLVTVTGMDPTQDVDAIKSKFADEAEKSFLETKKWMMAELKDDKTELVTSTVSASTTRKEPIKLPDFYGEEKKNPFTEYPTWKIRWDSLIGTYPAEHRWTILLDHLDEVAKSKFVGNNGDYEKAMERLDSFFGDPTKVLACSLKEINSQRDIGDGDHVALLTYSDVLESNFNRLTSLSLQHEISNSSSMKLILKSSLAT